MLYPLSCGELAINGEKILRLYGTRGVHIAWITCTNIPWNAEYLGPKMSFLQKKVWFKTFRFRSISMLYLRVQEKGKLAHKWKKTFANVMKWKRRAYVDTLHFFFYFSTNSEKKRTFQKEPSKKNIKKKTIKNYKNKKKQKKNGKFPGTGSPSWLGPLSRYNALPTELRGTCHEWNVNFKTIWNKRSTYCMDHSQNLIPWNAESLGPKISFPQKKVVWFNNVPI